MWPYLGALLTEAGVRKTPASLRSVAFAATSFRPRPLRHWWHPSAAKSRLAPADKLKREIQAAFDEGLADERYRTGHGRFDGCGYVGAEAYFRLAGGEESGLQPMQLTFRGKSRWWLSTRRAGSSTSRWRPGRPPPSRTTAAGRAGSAGPPLESPGLAQTVARSRSAVLDAFLGEPGQRRLGDHHVLDGPVDRLQHVL